MAKWIKYLVALLAALKAVQAILEEDDNASP